MKKLLCLAILFILAAALPALAKPEAEEFRNRDYDVTSIKTVLVMPVMFDVKKPESEAFFDEKISQKWKDLTSPTVNKKFPFLQKSPEDVVERDNYVKGTASADKQSPTKTAEKALSLDSDYVSAVLTATVTKCEIQVIRHPEEITWETRYRTQNVWIDGRLEEISIPYQYRNVKPAWNEEVSVATVKLEMRDAKKGTLVYGSSVYAATGNSLFVTRPSLTTHVCNVLENAAKRLPSK